MPASAQFGGLLSGVTRPFRAILGHLGHFPRHRRHHDEALNRSPSDTGRQNTSSASTNARSAWTNARLGFVGPPAWPTAYEDILGYTFWPDEYAQRLRGHGFDVIVDSITGDFERPRAPAQASTTGSAVQNDSAGGAACVDASTAPSDWPSTRIGQTVQLTNVQHNTVGTIQTAVNQSAETIKANCPDRNAQTAPDRLATLVQTLWTVRDGGVAVRASLKEFDDSLKDTQKTSFASRMTQAAPKPDATNQSAAMNQQYQACAQPNVEEAERFIKQIDLRIRPNKEQAASLENLHKVSSDMAKLLMASCAQPIPADPLARLDAAADQLTAMNYAATTVQIAFNDFYGRLDNTQKARFDSTGR